MRLTWMAIGSALLMFGCAASDPDPDRDSVEPTQTIVSPLTIIAKAALDPNSCDRALDYEVWNVAYADGRPVTDFTCQWRFDDGGSVDACAGSHEFSSPGFHTGTVVVRDSQSGASTVVETAEMPVRDPLSVDVVAQAPACGLVFSYATAKTGGANGGTYRVEIEPADSVATPDPWPANGTIQVSAPGTYTITVLREEESTALCTATSKTSVAVTACP